MGLLVHCSATNPFPQSLVHGHWIIGRLHVIRLPDDLTWNSSLDDASVSHMFHHLVEDCTVVPETSWLLNGKGLVCTCGRGLVCIRGKATRLYTRNVYGYAYRQKHRHTSYMLVCIYVYIQTCIPTYPFLHVPLTLRERVQINVSIPPHPNPKPTPLSMLKKIECCAWHERGRTSPMAQDRHKRVARPKVYSYLIVSNASRIQPISTLVTVHEDWCIPKKGATRNQILSWAVLPGILAAMDGSMRLPEPTRPPSWLQRPLTTFTTQDYQFMLQATARAYGGRDQHGGRDQQWWGQRSWYQDLREMRSYRAVVDENRLLRQLHGTMQSDKEREQSEKQRALECLTQETAEKQRALEALTQERATKQRALQALSLETAEKQRALEALAQETAAKEQALQALAEAEAYKERALKFRKNMRWFSEAKKAWMLRWIFCCWPDFSFDSSFRENYTFWCCELWLFSDQGQAAVTKGAVSKAASKALPRRKAWYAACLSSASYPKQRAYWLHFFILADSQRSWVDLLWVLWKIPSIKDLANVSLYSLIRGQCVILYRSFWEDLAEILIKLLKRSLRDLVEVLVRRSCADPGEIFLRGCRIPC